MAAVPNLASVRRMFYAAALLLGALMAGLAAAQSETAPNTQPESVQRFIAMFADPAVQAFLQQQAAAARATPEPAIQARDTGVSFGEFTTRFRGHITALLVAARSFPSETMRGAAILEREVEASGGTRPIFLVAAFVVAGLAVQWLFWRISAGWRLWMSRAPFFTVGERLVAVAARLLWAVCYVLAFGLGSIGFFLLFEWPPLMREIVVGYLFAVVVFRLASALFDVLLAPRRLAQNQFRLVPFTDEAAAHWAKRLGYAVGWYAFGWVTIRLLGNLGFSVPARQLVAYSLGVVLLVIGIEAVWRRPSGLSQTQQPGRIGIRARNWLWTAYFTAVWLLWVIGAMRLFWIVVVCAALPGAIALTKAAVNNVLHSSDTEEENRKRTVASVIVERGIRAVLIIGAIFFLADRLDIELTCRRRLAPPTRPRRSRRRARGCRQSPHNP